MSDKEEKMSIEESEKYANSVKDRWILEFRDASARNDWGYAEQILRKMKKFKFNSNPSTVIIDKNFNISLKHVGFKKDIYDFLNNHIERLLIEK